MKDANKSLFYNIRDNLWSEINKFDNNINHSYNFNNLIDYISSKKGTLIKVDKPNPVNLLSDILSTFMII